MRKRSREINVFSISALDLFASALGAFILMSLIFMVFFSMTSRESGQAEETHTALERCEAELADSVRASDLARCEERLSKVRIPHLDLVICLDITGSMGQQIEGLKRDISDLARILDSLAPSTGIGMVAYGDVEYDQVTHVHPIVPTSAMTSLGRFVASLEPRIGQGAGRNSDAPEALDTALAKAVAMNWRAESERRFIVVITDAPAYPQEQASAIARAGSFARAGNQFVSAVMVIRPDAQTFLEELARSGRGQFVNDVGGQSMIAGLLLAIMDV